MARIEWLCPITGEKLSAKVQPGQEFTLHLSAAGREAVGGEAGEAEFWKKFHAAERKRAVAPF